MKTVHTSDMVAHLWANQSQSTARTTNDSLYFQGVTIYSYGSHFPIAKHEQHKGKACVLFTTRGYSVTTTAKHIAIVRQACRHLPLVFVNNPLASLADNLAFEDAEYNAALVKAAGARKGRSQEKRKAEALQLLNRRNALALFMGAKPLPEPADFQEAAEKAQARAKAAQRAEDRKEWAGQLERLAQKEALFGATFPAWLELWRQGLNTVERWEYPPYARIAAKRDKKPYSTEWPCMLRMIKQGTEHETVETSWGAQVPAAHAYRIYKIWALVQGKVPPEGWTPKSQTEAAIGSFKVDRIDVDGTLHAGCHTITKEEIASFAKRMGW